MRRYKDRNPVAQRSLGGKHCLPNVAALPGGLKRRRVRKRALRHLGRWLDPSPTLWVPPLPVAGRGLGVRGLWNQFQMRGFTTRKNLNWWKSVSAVRISVIPCSRMSAAMWRSCILLPETRGYSRTS